MTPDGVLEVIDAIEARLDAATPGPWSTAPPEHEAEAGHNAWQDEYWGYWLRAGPALFFQGSIESADEVSEPDPDVEFVRHAPTDIAALVAVARAARQLAAPYMRAIFTGHVQELHSEAMAALCDALASMEEACPR